MTICECRLHEPIRQSHDKLVVGRVDVDVCHAAACLADIEAEVAAVGETLANLGDCCAAFVDLSVSSRKGLGAGREADRDKPMDR